MANSATPFYLDWTFWAFVTSAIAISLSQLPPVRQWFRGAKLIVETPKQMRITHIAGYASAGNVISIRNVGGRPARVKSVAFRLSREGKPLIDIPIMEFHPNPSAGTTLLLMPFTVPPGVEWTKSVNGYQDLSREKSRGLEKLVSAVKHDIGKKALDRDANTPGSKELVVLDAALLKKAGDLVASNFIWTAGEYELEIAIATEHPCAVKQTKWSFTIWESDEAELRSFANDFKYGFGIGVPHDRHARGVFVTLRSSNVT